MATVEGSKSARERIRSRRTYAVVAVAVGLLLAAGFAFESARATAFMQLQPSTAGDSLTVRGVTDLPDGTQIVFSVVAGDSTDQGLDAPYVDGSTTVADRTFEQVVDVSRFPAGPITVWAAFDPGLDQPAEALRRFGQDGSGLRGSGVVDDSGARRLVQMTTIERR